MRKRGEKEIIKKEIVRDEKVRGEIFVISYVVIIIAAERECSSLGGKCESPRGANCVFSFRCPIQLKSLEYNSLRFNVRHGATRGHEGDEKGDRGVGGRKSLIYSVNGVIRTRRRPYLVYQPVGIMSF